MVGDTRGTSKLRASSELRRDRDHGRLLGTGAAWGPRRRSLRLAARAPSPSRRAAVRL